MTSKRVCDGALVLSHSPFALAVLELLDGVAEHVLQRAAEGHAVLLVHVEGQDARQQRCRRKKQDRRQRGKWPDPDLRPSNVPINKQRTNIHIFKHIQD